MAAVLPWHAPGAIASQIPTTSWVITRGGGPGGNSPSSARTYLYGQPPVEVVLGAGAAGMLTGHLVFRSLLASVGLGVGAMGLAASADDRAGEVARASGRFMLATFGQAAELNDRYQLTTKLADVTRTAAHRIREFDKKNSVMRRATKGAKQAWLDIKQYDDTHGLTAKAGNALSLCLDRLATALSPRVDETWTNPVYGHSTGGKTHSDFRRGGNRYRDRQSGDRRYGNMKAYGSRSRTSYRRKGVLGGYGKDRLYDGRDPVDEDWWGVDDDDDSFWRR